MTVDKKQYYYVPVKVKKTYLSIFPHDTPSYFQNNLQNNYTPGDRYKVIRL